MGKHKVGKGLVLFLTLCMLLVIFSFTALAGVNNAPTVVAGEDTQTGAATPASNDGLIAAIPYTDVVNGWFTDADSESVLTYHIVSAVDASSANVTAHVTISANTISYTPDAAQASQDVTIVVKANDGTDDSTGNVTVTVAVGAVPAGAADKTALAAAITAEIGEDHANPDYILTETDYTVVSWNVYITAIAEAIAIENDAFATQTQVDAAAAAIDTAKSALAAAPAGVLTITGVAAGSIAGTTVITISDTAAPDNLFVYTVGDSAVNGVNMQETITGTAFESGTTEIPVTAGQYVTVYEVTSSNTAVNYVSVQISSGEIGQENQDQVAPTGLTGLAPTTPANDDGQITGVSDEMEYRSSAETNYTAVQAGAETITGLAPGGYYVRYAAKVGFNAGPDTIVIIPGYSAWDVWTNYASNSANDIAFEQEDKRITVYTAAGLAWAAKMVNAGLFADYTVELANNIDLSEHFWVPIGDNDIDMEGGYIWFHGIFDGNGKTISHLKIGQEDKPNSELTVGGLFGAIGEATIRNVVLANVEIYMSAASNIGSLVGSSDSSVIANSHAHCTISFSGDGGCSAGGLVGSAGAGQYVHHDSEIQGCSATGTVITSGSFGSIGGLLGSASYHTVKDSFSTCSVTASGGSDVNAGGLVGRAYWSGINDSCALGNVIACGDSSRAGGLVGYAEIANITDCYSRGHVTGSDNASVGGISGYTWINTILNCYATGSMAGGAGANVGGLIGEIHYNTTIANCYATGSVAGGLNARVGGLVGDDSTTGTTSGYWNRDAEQVADGKAREPGAKVGEGYYNDSSTAKTSAEMRSGEFVALLNSQVSALEDESLREWERSDDKNEGYPIFVGGIHMIEMNLKQSPPAGLSGVMPTSTANDDGKISGVTTEMEYRPSTSPEYTAVTGTMITSLAPGTYYVRMAAKTGYDASADTLVVVPEFTGEEDSWDQWGDYKSGTGPDIVSSTVDGAAHYTVYTGEGLAWIAAQVNSGTDNFAGATITLGADIDLSAHFWVPIGDLSASPDNSFCGIFDGKGKTISGLKIGSSDPNTYFTRGGLFGSVLNATIKNVYLTDLHIYSSSESGGYFGGLAGMARGSAITDCYTSGSITCRYESRAGGLVGTVNNCLVKRCSSSVAVTGYVFTYMGGLIGYAAGSQIIDSNATGDVRSDGLAGGLVGVVETASVIKNSYAVGNIISEDQLDSSHHTSGYFGGLVGVALSFDSSYEIINSYAAGNIIVSASNFLEGSPHIGGLVGRSLVSDTITFGYWNSDATHILFDTEITEKKGIGDGADTSISKTSDEMKSSDFVADLNAYASKEEDLALWEIVAGKNAGYPLHTGVDNAEPEPKDTEAPVLSAPDVSNAASTTVSLSFTSNEAGTYYYLIYSSTDTPPDAAALKAQGEAKAKGTGTAVAGVNTVSVTGLTALTSYKAYAIVVDGAGNASAIGEITFTTTSASTSTGGGSGGSSSTPAASVTPAVTTSTSGTGMTATAAVSGTTNAGTNTTTATVPDATVTGLISNVQQAEATGQRSVIEIKVESGIEAATTEVNIPGPSFVKIADSTDAELKISCPMGTVTFDAGAVESISQAAASGDIHITMTQVNTDSLTDEAKAAVGDRPVYDFSVKAGSTGITAFGTGSVQISIPYTLREGEDRNAIVVYYMDSSGSLQPVRGAYDPSTGNVTFFTTHFSPYMIGYNKVIFSDVPDTAWYSEAVVFLAARNITSGTGDHQFSPQAALTRGDFMVMLMKTYEIETEENPADNFTDAGNTYYTNYLAEAKRLGIAKGVDNNKFEPEREITRQDMFTLLYRVLDMLGELPDRVNDTELESFSDAGDIADAAKIPMQVLLTGGIITGNEGKLNPADATTRAQMTQVLYNLLSQSGH